MQIEGINKNHLRRNLALDPEKVALSHEVDMQIAKRTQLSQVSTSMSQSAVANQNQVKPPQKKPPSTNLVEKVYQQIKEKTKKKYIR